MKGFDKVLLDAPCTGLGVISRDPSIKSNRTILDVKKAAHLQRELLRAAVDVCKVGGTIVYSTCSIAAEENEGVIDYIIRKRFVKVVETGLPIEKEGITKYEDNRYDPRVKLTRRVYPHMHNMDGFFIAKLIKLQNGPKEPEGKANEKKPASSSDKKKGASKTAPTEDVVEEEEEEQDQAPVVPEEKKKISKKMLGKRDRLRLKGKLKRGAPLTEAAFTGRRPPAHEEDADVDAQKEQASSTQLKKRKPEVQQPQVTEKRKNAPVEAKQPAQTQRKPSKEQIAHGNNEEDEETARKLALKKKILELKMKKAHS
jgi:hypothetical protein